MVRINAPNHIRVFLNSEVWLIAINQLLQVNYIFFLNSFPTAVLIQKLSMPGVNLL